MAPLTSRDLFPGIRNRLIPSRRPPLSPLASVRLACVPFTLVHPLLAASPISPPTIETLWLRHSPAQPVLKKLGQTCASCGSFLQLALPILVTKKPGAYPPCLPFLSLILLMMPLRLSPLDCLNTALLSQAPPFTIAGAMSSSM